MSSILFGVAVVFTVVPMAVSQCTTSRCAERGYKPPRWENGALYLETLLSETSNTLRKAVEARLVAQSEAMEARLTAQSQAVEKLAKAFDNRFASFEKTLNTRMDAFQASQENRTTDIASDIQRLAEQSSGIATHSAEQSETTKELAKAIDDRFASLEEALNTRMDAMEESNANRTYDITAKMQEPIGNITSSMQGMEEHSEAFETRQTEQTVALETRLAQQEVAITSNLTGAINAKYTSLKTIVDEATYVFNNRVDALQKTMASAIKLATNYTEYRVQGDLVHVNTSIYDVVHSLQSLTEQSKTTETRLTEQAIALVTRLAKQEDAIKTHLSRAIAEKCKNATDTVEAATYGFNATIDVLQEVLTNRIRDLAVEVANDIQLSSNYTEHRVQDDLAGINTTLHDVVYGMEQRVTGAHQTALKATELRLQDKLEQSIVTIRDLVRGSERTLVDRCSSLSASTRQILHHLYGIQPDFDDLLKKSTVVFLRRKDGIINFTRPWADYKVGFGDRAGEFWLGLGTLHALTTRRQYKLRVELTDWSGERKWEVHNHFSVGGEGDKYRLSVSGYDRSVSTTREDYLPYNNGRQFSTIDNDNDGHSSVNCAMRAKGGWWYGDCHSYNNPTGVYRPAGYTGYNYADGGIKWLGAYRDYRPFKELTLKLIPV